MHSKLIAMAQTWVALALTFRKTGEEFSQIQGSIKFLIAFTSIWEAFQERRSKREEKEEKRRRGGKRKNKKTKGTKNREYGVQKKKPF